MDNHTTRILGLALLMSLNLACSATIAQGRTIAGDDMGGGEKINVPYGLCVFEKACDNGICFCCLVNRICYASMDECKSGCGNPPASEDIVEASARKTTTPSLTPSPAK
ncbi:hypothetical protein ACQJBY_020109 [Aegilops geniculata]